MSFNPNQLNPTGLDAALVNLLIQEHEQQVLPRLGRLWDYYRNDMTGHERPGRVGRNYHLAQEQGLPARLGGTADPTRGFVDVAADAAPRREVVIENDIGWRINTLVDFMFGKPVVLQSCAPDRERGRVIERFLNEVFEFNGGVSFFQDLALLGSVHGHVDVLLRVDPPAGGSRRRGHRCQGNETGHRASREGANQDKTAGDGLPNDCELIGLAKRFVLETVEAPRAVPVLNASDYRRLDAYVLHYRQWLNEVDDNGFLARVRSRVLGGSLMAARRATVDCTQIWTDQTVLRFEGSAAKRALVEQVVNPLGRIPVVHIQNLPQPFFYEGLSEVEPLIPLQDELNTRLSDRANRVTFQSFKMYLGKGIEKFTERCVGPGQMWATDNPDADIKEFGGDSTNPSEDQHINEIREAMDKTSSVTPLAAGLVRNKIGNLTSENALRVTLMGVLAKTDKKRVTYGKGIQRMAELILHAADVFGLLPNSPSERKIRLDWPSALPENDTQRLRDAQAKIKLGIPREQVLAELGYGDCA